MAFPHRLGLRAVATFLGAARFRGVCKRYTTHAGASNTVLLTRPLLAPPCVLDLTHINAAACVIGMRWMGLAMVHTLVPSDRVEAAAVFGPGGERIGTIERLMFEKTTGKVAYAVVRCAGRFGADVHHYPVAWNSLKCNVTQKAYETSLTLDELHSGPSELDGEAFDWGDRSPPYRHLQYWTV